MNTVLLKDAISPRSMWIADTCPARSFVLLSMLTEIAAYL